MRHPKNLQEVVASGLCCGCGLCAALAGSDEIEMGVSAAGHSRPRFSRDGVAGSSNELLAVCPGATLTGPERRDEIRLHPVWGPMAEVHRSWAADPEVRYRAAAGGTLTGLARYMLDHGEVDAVLQVRASATDPVLTDAVVSRTGDEALAAAKSRYGPAAPLVHVRHLLDDELRFAVIAKPCDVSAIRNLGRRDPRVATNIPYLLTFFCGGVPSRRTAEQIIAHHGVGPDDVAAFQWRGDGWPGPTRVTSWDGAVFDLSYDEVWFEDRPWLDPFELQWRCKMCPDAIGEVADISCPDGWVMRDGKPIHDEADGVNLAIVRSEAGRQLLARAVKAGYIETAPVTDGEIDQMHADHKPRKLGHPARRLGMALAGAPTTRVRGYRSGTTVRLAGLRNSVNAFRGTFRRVRSGRHREPAETI